MKIRAFPMETKKAAFVANPSLALLLPVLAILAVSTACMIQEVRAQYGPADVVGQALENAGRNIRRGVQMAADASRGPVVVYEQPLVARVQARLQWEKLLMGSTIDLEVIEDGTAILRGEVASKEVKERAFMLARDTVGIRRVIDELVVPTSATRVVPAPDPLPETRIEPAPPMTGAEGAVIRIRPARVVGRIPRNSTRVIVGPSRVAPVTTDVIIQP